MNSDSSLKHVAIAATLEREIRSGGVRPGARLPGENTLAERFAVSRTTVRRALSALTLNGLISTRNGKGSFVAFRGAVLDISRGWAVALADRGVDAPAEVLRLELVVDPLLAARVATADNEFIAIDRVRRVVGGGVISYERSRIPAIGSLRGLPETGLVDGSIAASLFAEGLVCEQGEQWVSARRLLDDEAEILGRTDVCLHSERVSRMFGGEFVEYVESALDPAHFQLHLQFR